MNNASLESRLASLAKSGQTITYGELARDLGQRIGTLTSQLEVLMEADAAAGRPFRSVLCCGRLLNGMPATGFFLKATELGRLAFDASPASQAEFVATERRAIWMAASAQLRT